MGMFKRKSDRATPIQEVQPKPEQEYELVVSCYCSNGHNMVSDLATFSEYEGITLKLRNEHQEGMLSLSPIIGDMSRTFFDVEWDEGEIVEICCPVCSDPLPVYSECTCGADLIAMFTSEKNDFSNCIGICQRIGCTHSEIKSNRQLRSIKPIRFF